MGAKRRPNLRVRAGDRYGDPWPVANVPSYRCEHLNRDRLETPERSRQVADHATRLVGQSQLHRPVQILDDITEPSGNPQDHYLTYDARSEPRPCSDDRTGG